MFQNQVPLSPQFFDLFPPFLSVRTKKVLWVCHHLSVDAFLDVFNNSETFINLISDGHDPKHHTTQSLHKGSNPNTNKNKDFRTLFYSTISRIKSVVDAQHNQSYD